jgi:uroporphyrinogen III methyltransferase / synthase
MPKKPLAGRTILVTRTAEQAPEFAALLEAEGANVISFPAIKIVPPHRWKGVDQAIRQIQKYDWLLFTSANGVSMFMKRLQALRKKTKDLQGVRIGAIGPKTSARLSAGGLRVRAFPEEYRAEALAKVLGKVRGCRILLARAQKAREVLPKILRARGATVSGVTLYRTLQAPRLPAALKKNLMEGRVDVLTFTSSSTVRAFMRHFSTAERRRLFAHARAAVIGPITAATLRGYGITPAIQATPYTVEALTKAIADYFVRAGPRACPPFRADTGVRPYRG